MADEIPPAPSESIDDLTKSETIRITLPPKSDQPAVKRETVRINVPGKPAPKKETTKLTPAAPAGAAPTAPKPFLPPPPAPKSLPTAPPPPAAKPLSGVNPPPKPPSLGARPTVPLKPAPAPAPSGVAPAPAAGAEPVTQKAAAPKKETARITLPPEGAKSALPKATVKMQQTQPLAPRPSAIQQAPAVAQAPAAALSTVSTSDPLIGALSWGAIIAAVAAAIMIFLAMGATAPV